MLKGLETLAVRVERQTASAAKLADHLAGHKKIKRLIYPGRPDHPQADIIKKQMTGGSNLIAFEVKGNRAAAFKVANAFKIIRISNNLGDAKSLVTHPSTTTHQRLSEEARRELGITPGHAPALGRAGGRRGSGGRSRAGAGDAGLEGVAAGYASGQVGS